MNDINNLNNNFQERERLEKEKREIQEKKELEYRTQLATSRANHLIISCVVLAIADLCASFYWLGFQAALVVLHIIVIVGAIISKVLFSRNKKNYAAFAMIVSVVNSVILLLVSIYYFYYKVDIFSRIYFSEFKYAEKAIIIYRFFTLVGMAITTRYIYKAINPIKYKDRDDAFYEKYEDGMKADMKFNSLEDFEMKKEVRDINKIYEPDRFFNQSSEDLGNGITNMKDEDYEDFEDIERKI